MKFQKFGSYMIKKLLLSVLYFFAFYISLVNTMKFIGLASDNDMSFYDPMLLVTAYVFFTIAYLAYCISYYQNRNGFVKKVKQEEIDEYIEQEKAKGRKEEYIKEEMRLNGLMQESYNKFCYYNSSEPPLERTIFASSNKDKDVSEEMKKLMIRQEWQAERGEMKDIYWKDYCNAKNKLDKLLEEEFVEKEMEKGKNGEIARAIYAYEDLLKYYTEENPDLLERKECERKLKELYKDY